MPWVYLDDGFDEHPKVEAAGGAAAWLYVVALCYCRRNKTMGRLPKSRLSRLNVQRNVTQLAARLVRVGLWEDQGDCFQIHNYEVWNQTEAKEKRARQAAKARWDGHAERNAECIASSSASSNAERNASAMPHARAPQSPIPNPNYSSSSTPPLGLPRAEEEEPLGREAERQAALRALAERRLERTTSNVTNREAWIASTAKRLNGEYPDLTPDQLRALMDTPVPAAAPDGPDALAAAQKRRHDLERRRRAHPCPECDGDMRVETAKGVWADCPTCDATGIAPQEAAR